MLEVEKKKTKYASIRHSDECRISSTTTIRTRKAERDDKEVGKEEERKWPAPSSSRSASDYFFLLHVRLR